ncbi:right-handed parallel beta-helix repeat-containing protein [Streptococcus jiangjianxini]|uniref:right-handed parallel beta-helix repeat-containing protein n=1 Tax=Streptococcus jiangjianxini TaxID=3161189 RepID=UPI0032EB6589
MSYDFRSMQKNVDEALANPRYYTDFGDVDPNVLHQITELQEFLRTKGSGRAFREAVVQLFERYILTSAKEGNANLEVSKARGYFGTLAEHLSAIDEKATTKLDAIVSGSPKKVLATLGELQSNFPNGAEGVFVVSENGHWYYWDGSVWQDGGVYQSAVLADYQKGSYLMRVLDKVKKVQSNLKILTISEGTRTLYESTTFSNDNVTIAPGGYFFPKIRLDDAQDVYLTLHNANYPNRIKVGIKLADGSLIKTFDLKGATTDKTHYLDLNDYLGVTSETGAFIEIRVDNRNQSDVLTIDKFLVGKGGIPVSKEDSMLTGDINIIKRIANVNLVRTNLDLLDSYNISQSHTSGSKITVDPNGYYFPVVAMNKAKDIYITLHGVSHPERITARIRRGLDSVIAPFDLPGSVADDVYYLNLNDYMDVGARPDDLFEIRVDNRNQSDVLTIDKFLVGKGGIPNDFWDNQKEVYVDGTATSKGIGTASSPFLTIQEALESGAETILVKAGTYKGPITASNRKRLTIRAVAESGYNVATHPDVKGVSVSNVNILSLSADNGLYSMSYTGTTDSRLHRVFVSKLLPVKDGGTRSIGYNVTLWEDTGNMATSKRLVPVLTKLDCQSQKGSFYYDGQKIFVNATDGTVEGKTYKLLDEEEVVAAFSNIAHLDISGINFEGGNASAVRLRNITQFDLTKVEASKSGLGDGISCNDSNGTFTSCKAFHNRNDGFNFHGFGDTHLIDCEGHYNFDDGNSHHDGCTGTIVRGEWSYNGKGGCSPTYGAIIHLDSVYSHHNRYGFYCDGSVDNPKRTVRHSNCISKDNTSADYLIGTIYTVLGMSNSFSTKTGAGEYIQLNKGGLMSAI